MNSSEQVLIKPYSISQWLKIINALFLIAGTCIGGGMLALPILSSTSGFWPSVMVMFLTCIFMTMTGLLFLEATLWMKKGSHVISLSKELLNQFGQVVCWIVYLFIGYASLIAYTSGGGKEISFVITKILHFSFSDNLGAFAFLISFGGIIYLGHRIVERVNTILFISMMMAYVFMLSLAPNEIQSHLLERQDWNANHLFLLVPLMLATFSFPGIVPTIVPYLNRDVKSIRIAIIGGTSLTFIIYVIWLLIVLGTVPHEGAYGLKEALICDIPATECLHYATQSPLFSYIAQFFAFFALTTSFLGIALALFDFLSDGLKISKKGKGKLVLSLLIAIPTLFFASYFQRIFLIALELTGGIGDAIISGLIPAMMVWKGRYKLSKKGEYQVMGGKPLLVFICLTSASILTYEIIKVFFNF